MLMGMVVLNAVCLLATLALLVRLWRPTAPPEVAESFATVLAALRPAAAVLRPKNTRGLLSENEPPASATSTPALAPTGGDEGGTSEGVIAGLPLWAQFAIIRHMVQGKSAEEAAAVTGVAPSAAAALYRLQKRGAGETCSRPLS
jgi:hypothetical protein